MRYFVLRYFLPIILLFAPMVVLAETRYVAPDFIVDVTWTKDKSPYIIDGDMVLEAGKTLTIEKGTTVLAATTTSLPYKPFITTWGNIVSKGTDDEPVKISGFSNFLIRGPYNSIEHTTFENSPLHISKNSFTPYATTTFLSSRFTGSGTAILVHAGDVLIKDSQIDGNTSGIVPDYRGFWNSLVVTNSEFENNQADITNAAEKVVDARGNWWGKADGPSGTVSGPVTVSPWLTEKPGTIKQEIKPIACCSSVLFLPGLEASRLYRDDADLLGGGTTTHRAWEPYTNADVQSLYLSSAGESINPIIHVNGIIDSAYGLKAIYSKFITLMNDAVTNKTINDWLPFAYDWRMAADGTASNLLSEVRRMAANSKTGKVTVIAHSNGGLVAKNLVKKLESTGESYLIDRVILVAVPQLGTPQAVAAMLHGDSQDILGGLMANKSTMRSLGLNMQSAYGLLPTQEFFTKIIDPVITFAGKAIGSYDAFAKFLTSGRTSPQTSDMKTPAVLSSDLLSKSQTMHSLDALTFPTSTKLLAVAGWGVPTIQTLDYSSSTLTIKRSLNGDGTVVAKSALGSDSPYLYFNQGLFNFDQRLQSTHTDIFETQPLRDLLSKLIATTTLDANNMYSSYISTDNPEKLPWNSWLTVSVHSPVDLDIYDSKGGHMGKIPLPGATSSDLSWFENTIGGQVDEIGDEKYYTIPGDDTYSVQMKGTGIGSFTFEVKKYTGGDMTEVGSTTYADLPVTPLLSATAVITGTSYSPTLNLDVDGNGTPDIQTTPHTTPDPNISLDAMKVLVSSLSLDKNEEKQILKRIEKVRALLLTDKKDLIVKKITSTTEQINLGHWNLRNLSDSNKTMLTSMFDALLASLESA